MLRPRAVLISLAIVVRVAWGTFRSFRRALIIASARANAAFISGCTWVAAGTFRNAAGWRAPK